jgi:hypothetical protein
MTDEEREAAAAEYLLTQCELKGVGLLSVEDGKVLMFSEKTLAGLLAEAKANGTGRVILFLQTSTEKDRN